MTAFPIIVFVVMVAGIVLAVVFMSRSGGSFGDIGRSGTLWFDRQADIPVEDRPSEDDRDAPLPRRPLRGRPQ